LLNNARNCLKDTTEDVYSKLHCKIVFKISLLKPLLFCRTEKQTAERLVIKKNFASYFKELQCRRTLPFENGLFCHLKIESVCSFSANLQMTMRYTKIDVQQCDCQFVQLNRLPSQRLVGCLVGRSVGRSVGERTLDDNFNVI
ncbi:hypothetical protein T11_15422, partial [Trichinella zimbabwensis]